MGLTNFPNGISSFGMPVLGSTNLAMMFDRSQDNLYWFVDGKNGSTNNNGKSPESPLSTIASAITKANAAISWSSTPWGPRHTIFIAPGLYAEALTSLPYGCNLIGLGDAFDLNGQRGVTIKPASGYPVDVTSCINSRIQNICFESPDASACFRVQNLNRNVIDSCIFSGVPGASPTTVYGLQVRDATAGDGIGDMTGTRISNCIFQVVQNGLHITTDNASSKQASGNIIDNCIFRGISSKGIYFHINCVPSYTIINNCIVGNRGQTLTLGLDDDTDLVAVSNTNFWATANDPAHQGSGQYNNCYLNGTLITNS